MDEKILLFEYLTGLVATNFGIDKVIKVPTKNDNPKVVILRQR